MNNKKNSHIGNLLKVNKSFNKLRKWIQLMWSLLFNAIRFLIFLVTSPILIIMLLIIFVIIWIYLSWISSEKFDKYNSPSIIINKEEVKILWLETFANWQNKGKLKWCEDIDIPENIYTSLLPTFSENSFNNEKHIYNNLCFYHLLYLKTINRDYTFDIEERKIEKLSRALKKSDKLSKEQVDKLSIAKNKIINEINITKSVLNKLQLPYIWENRFQIYWRDKKWKIEYGFQSRIDYPVEYFKNNQEQFLDMMYYYHIWVEYWESFTWWIELWYAFWENSKSTDIMFNTLNELGNEYNKANMWTWFLNWNHWLNDFISDLNNSAYYYNFRCHPCKKKWWCSCTWDPKEDGKGDYEEDNEWIKDFNNYVNFIYWLVERKVIYVSDNVKSPFRNYTYNWKECKVKIKLTQRDWPSNLRFSYFKWYPLIDGVSTHAWLDFATVDNCNGDEVPVYSITDWIVHFKSYSLTSWWNSIIIKTILNWDVYYVRYSHLKDLPVLSKWDFVNTNTLIWVQGDSWPSTAEHLDVTIYDWNLKYKDYLRDTLNWWWIFSFTFEDMMQDWFSDYSIESYINTSCYNCK